MPVTNYYTVNGEIISESTDGVYLDYLTDALGSVTAKVDQNCNVVSTARYKPYGDLLSGTQYKLGWVGTLGYRWTDLKYSGEYVRARHFSSEQGQWSTLDPIWPREPGYGYVRCKPQAAVDPSGRYTIGFGCKCVVNRESYHDQLQRAASCLCDGGTFITDEMLKCVKACSLKWNVPISMNCLRSFCIYGKIECRDCALTDRPCRNPILKGRPLHGLQAPCATTPCDPNGGEPKTITLCCNAVSSLYEACGNSTLLKDLNCREVAVTLYHEIAHSCGNGGLSGCNRDPTKALQDRNTDFGYCLQGCAGDLDHRCKK